MLDGRPQYTIVRFWSQKRMTSPAEARGRHPKSVAHFGERQTTYLACVVLNNQVDFTGNRNLCAQRHEGQFGAQVFELHIEVDRDFAQDLAVTNGGRNQERNHGLALGLDLDDLSWLHSEGGAVNDLAIHKDVAVANSLAGLCGSAGKAGTQHDCVEVSFQQLDERFTGLAGELTGVVERATQLLLIETVLGTQALLFTQTNGVVRFGTAASTTALTRRIGTLFEVLNSLRGKRNTQCT